jgi:hypothetical protein
MENKYWTLLCQEETTKLHNFPRIHGKFFTLLYDTLKTACDVIYCEITQFKRNVSHRHLFITKRLAVPDG